MADSRSLMRVGPEPLIERYKRHLAFQDGHSMDSSRGGGDRLEGLAAISILG